VELTPEVVWSVTPWSWLIDWFTDLGSFMTNITELNGDDLVLRYGYVMCETRETYTKTVYLKPRASSTFPTAVSSSWSSTVKQRQRATPYGFGLDTGAFSSRQWSILSSLGLTRSDRSLR
jgi:hypothetical protein